MSSPSHEPKDVIKPLSSFHLPFAQCLETRRQDLAEVAAEVAAEAAETGVGEEVGAVAAEVVGEAEAVVAVVAGDEARGV